jgi:hypothetical protein
MKYVFLVSLIVLFQGCTSTPGLGVNENVPHHKTTFGESRVQFENFTLNHAINVVRVDTRRVEGGLLKIFVTLRNTGNHDRWIKARTTFLDADGHQLEQTNWEPLYIDRRNVVEYTCVSFSDRAEDYQLLIYNNK